MLIFLNTPSSSVHISTYYQIITLLNTKSNVVVLYIIYVAINLNYFSRGNKMFYVNLMPLMLVIVYDMFSSSSVHYLTYMSYYNNSLNTNLINGIVLIHPIFLYTFYTLLLIKIWTYYIYDTEFFFKSRKQYSTCTSIVINLYSTVLILAALVLGCWWAEQELSWGGWWSWDFVELVALNFLVFYLGKIHLSEGNYNTYFFRPTLLLMLIVVSVVVVRFNIVNSVHNFVNLESQNQYMYYINLTLILFNVLILLRGHYTNKRNKYKVGTINKLFNLLFLFFSFLFLVNITSASVFYVFSDINKNVQYIYLYAIILAIVINTTFIKTCNLVATAATLLMFFYFEVIVVDYVILLPMVLYLILVKTPTIANSNINAVATIHICLYLFLFLVVYQIFFFGNIFDNVTVYQTISFKVSSCMRVFNATTLNYFTESNNYQTSNSKGGVDIFSSAINGSTTVIAGFFKNIFEKDVVTSCFFVLETYSYNLQTLIQINSSIPLLLLLITLSLWIIISTKNTSKHLLI